MWLHVSDNDSHYEVNFRHFSSSKLIEFESNVNKQIWLDIAFKDRPKFAVKIGF